MKNVSLCLSTNLKGIEPGILDTSMMYDFEKDDVLNNEGVNVTCVRKSK